MKINYNKEEKSIEIKDGIKNKYLLYKFLIVLNLLNAILNLLYGIKMRFGNINILWIFLGIAFTYLFYIYFVKKITLEIIPIEQIKEIREKTFIGKKFYFIKLNDGKERDLIDMKTETAFYEFKKMLAEITKSEL